MSAADGIAAPKSSWRLAAARVAVGVALIYAAILPPFLMSPDEQSMLAVSLSIVDGQGVAVPSDLGTIGADGRSYSNWYPLNSVLALPAVGTARFLAARAHLPPRYVAAPFAVAWVALLTALTCGVMIRAAVDWGAAARDAVAMAAAYAFGTIALVYGRSFYAESLLSGITMTAAWSATRDRRGAAVDALLCGLAVLAKPTGIVVGLALGLFHLANRRIDRSVAAASGSAIGLSAYLVYNAVRFGRPLMFGQPWEGFRANVIPEAIAGLLLSPGRGLLWYSPVALLALWWLGRDILSRRRPAVPTTLALLVFGGFLGVHSLWSQWAGGWSWGPRLLMPAFPVVLASATALRSFRLRPALAAALVGLAVGIPTVFTTLNRTLTAATESHYSLEDQIWSFRAAPIVLSWPAAASQIDEARSASVTAVVGSAGVNDATVAGAEAFKVLPLWWWMLPVVGIPQWAGLLLALILTATGIRSIAGAAVPENETRGGALPPVVVPLGKRALDVCLSGLGLVASSPIALSLAALIKLEDGGPVFYTQDRVGEGGSVFTVFKFRSMVPNAEATVGALQATEKDPRITRIGHLMRATAMDELPQLWNIFRGDMSFVGPRALRPGEIEASDGVFIALEDIPGYADRCRMRPGLTGVAQIYAPRDVGRRNKFRYDRVYARRESFWLDIRLILLSFWITFRGRWEHRGDKV